MGQQIPQKEGNYIGRVPCECLLPQFSWNVHLVEFAGMHLLSPALRIQASDAKRSSILGRG